MENSDHNTGLFLNNITFYASPFLNYRRKITLGDSNAEIYIYNAERFGDTQLLKIGANPKRSEI